MEVEIWHLLGTLGTFFLVLLTAYANIYRTWIKPSKKNHDDVILWCSKMESKVERLDERYGELDGKIAERKTSTDRIYSMLEGIKLELHELSKQVVALRSSIGRE